MEIAKLLQCSSFMSSRVERTIERGVAIVLPRVCVRWARLLIGLDALDQKVCLPCIHVVVYSWRRALKACHFSHAKVDEGGSAPSIHSQRRTIHNVVEKLCKTRFIVSSGIVDSIGGQVTICCPKGI